MKLSAPIPTLATPSIKDTVDFYVSVLDFQCKAMDEQSQSASLGNGQVTLQVAHIRSPFDGPVFTGEIYIEMECVDELWEKVKDKAEVCFPIQNFDDGMREFGIYDNNGYMLQFAQALPA